MAVNFVHTYLFIIKEKLFFNLFNNKNMENNWVGHRVEKTGKCFISQCWVTKT